MCTLDLGDEVYELRMISLENRSELLDALRELADAPFFTIDTNDQFSVLVVKIEFFSRF